MKRAPYTYGVDQTKDKYWRSLGEFQESPEFQQALEREFPEGASELNDPPSRRAFLQVMGASIALAGFTGCRRPEEHILPYSRAPEEVIPGKALYYATAMPFAGTAVGLLVESHEGRPTKIEGNPRHPESLGATNAWLQAAVLDLYDVDRSPAPRQGSAPRSWGDAAAYLRARGQASRGAQGRGLVVLTDEHRSPTLAALLDELKRDLPQAEVVRYQAVSRHNAREGARLAFGRPLETIDDPTQAKVLLVLDGDFLHTEGGPIRQARAFADGRRLDGTNEMNRLYVVESRFSVTGASADHRLRLASRDVPLFAQALAAQLASLGVSIGVDAAALRPARKPAAPKFDRWVAAVAKDLVANRGASLVVAGDRQPPEVHALVALINVALGNEGRTVRRVKAFAGGGVDATHAGVNEGPAAIKALAERMKKGEVDTLLVLGGNPVYDAPADCDFAGALAKVPNSVHLGLHLDETGSACGWHLNRAHELESWSDVCAADGTASVVQPLIAPLLDGKTAIEVVDLFLGRERKGYEALRAQWGATHPTTVFETVWRRALFDGLWKDSAYPVESAPPTPAAVAAAWNAYKPAPAEGFELSFQPDMHAWDGRYANNGWLQEVPEPMTKLTWDNAALIAPAAATRLGLRDGDVVQLTVAGLPPVKFPVLVAPGQAEDSIAVTIGQGRTVVGEVGKGAGFNACALRSTQGFGWAPSVNVAKTGETYKLATTQEQASMEGRPIVREARLTEFVKEPDFAKKAVEHPPLRSLFADYKYDGHKWGMVIDLNACIGCNACMVSCQSENNIPVVGKTGVINERSMHWIRVDRYFKGENLDEPEAAIQPMSCQQCENAPCEQVCPVGATSHSPEGLNDMAYNRCIGTRYCANNCPYKVRRFNFFNYQNNFERISELRRMQYNPDVTVRARGVMEKCTYCVQRINETKIHIQQEGRDRVKDGEVVAACQQGCPTKAISFGDLNDPASEVAKKAGQARDYKVLAELNVRPRTSYLARVRNPNPELDAEINR